MSKSSLIASAVLAAGLAANAMAQFTDADTTCGGAGEANGGCNFAAPPQNTFQNLGNLGIGSYDITGQCGTFDPAGGSNNTNRDLDWYTFTLTTQAKFSINAGRDDGSSLVLFLGDGNSCPLNANYLAAEVASFTPQEFFLNAGTYTFVISTVFEPVPTAPVHACGGYSVIFDITDGISVCGTGSTQPCDVAHLTPGCDDWNCCNLVCAADPHCCDTKWDAPCVNNGAVAICGYFIYNCNDTDPANDCLTSATTISLNATTPFDITNANTDGPSTMITGAGSATVKDLWYFVQAPGNGQLTVVVNTPTWDSVIELYGAFNTNDVLDPAEEIPPAYIGTVDNNGAGGEGVTLIDAQQGMWYLVRVGQWDQDATPAGVGDITASFAQVVYTTGVQKFVVSAAGVNTNLGLSSGALSAAQPRRWLARPFTVPAPGAGNVSWDLSQIIGKGFIGGGTVETLNWIIWKADAAFAVKPVAADQLFAGSVPLPTPFDDALDSAATASYPIVLDPPVNLTEGNYYLTVYGASATDFAHGGSAVANWAWFIYSPEGITQQDGVSGWSWRSSDFPTPGFVKYTGLNGAWNVQTGDDQFDVYNNAFTILGSPVAGAEVCTGDLNDDGVVDAADLAGLLGQWGGPGSADFDASGTVDAADLAQLLGAWGSCP